MEVYAIFQVNDTFFLLCWAAHNACNGASIESTPQRPHVIAEISAGFQIFAKAADRTIYQREQGIE